ncbi:DNA polymerase III subunit alpha, partial [Cohnella sp.]|uniref:DNA polymerase III subunit alpha n=1 Tax=Cohnella sp. TaxID=1883426 RepID=UPI003565357E
FQLESTGMRRVLKEMKPSSFEDIVSAVALYRPGPMEFIPQFIRAKHGLVEVEYPHPNLKEILADTYGIIVYQEQIMQIASVMAGFSLGQADLLRRAVGKKKREVLDEQRKHFVAGSLKLGYSEQEANGVYDLIVRFADYGFCRAHAAAYAVLAFQTAYLKAHYPVAFMASMLTAVVGNQRKTAEYVDECRRMGIAVLKPDVNESGVLFTPVAFAEGGGAIRFGLAGVKNVGTQAIESIMRERAERPYESLSDFCRRIDPRACNKRVIESLVQAGALESMPGHRAQQLAALEPTVAAAALWRKEREELQIELFDFEETPNWNVELPAVPAYSQTQMLELERDLMGLYLSGHPLDAYDELMEELKVERLVDIAELPDGATAFTAGMIVSMKPFVTRKGQAMAFLEIEDRIMGTELVAFPSAWAKASSFVKKGSLVFVRAKVQLGDEDYKLLADDILPLDAGDLKAQAERLRRLSSGGRSGGAGGGGYSGRGGDRAASAGPAASKSASGAASSSARARAVAEAAPAAAASADSEQQRVYILIDAEHEKPATLIRLKLLLKAHPGKLPTILRYEKDRRTVALSDEYYVDPKPALVEELEQLLGKDRVRVK